MKQILLLTLLCFTPRAFYGQACGIYRIDYVGKITSLENEVVKVHLPTTWFLSGYGKRESQSSFVEATLTNDVFELQIGSEMTTPYTEIAPLLKLYTKQCDKFVMKVTLSENGIIHEEFIELDWNQIDVSIIDDEYLGTLFRFDIGEIIL